MQQRAKLSTRPESARTTETKLTLQSESNLSATFSESDTFGSKRRIEEKDFGRHVEKLDKEARFKHLAGPLPTITEKKENEEFRNQTCKPFENRRPSQAKKPSEKPQPTKPTKASNKPQPSIMSVSSTSMASIVQPKKPNKFVQKSIRKMNQLTIPQQEKSEEEVRLNFAAFVKDDPVKRRQLLDKQKQEEKKMQKKEQPNKISRTLSQEQQKKKEELQKFERQMRQRRMRQAELNKYVNQRELNNIDTFPINYEFGIEKACKRMKTDRDIDQLEKLDIGSEQPDGNVFTAMMNIEQLDRRLQTAENNKQPEDDLQYSQISQQEHLPPEVLSQLRLTNNLFLTEVMKGRISQRSLEELTQLSQSKVKFEALQVQDFSDSEDEQQEKKAKPGNRIIQRNKIQAVGGLYQDCDYLSEEHKRRLDQLMKDIEMGVNTMENPFELQEAEREHLKRLDQGLTVFQTLFQSEVNNDPVIYENTLPKDPNLRRQSQLKILRDKIASVNNSLRTVQQIPVDRFKIKAMLEKLHEAGVSQPRSELIEMRRQQFAEITQKIQDSEAFVTSAQENRQEIQSALAEIKERWDQLQKQLRQLDNMSEEEIRELERKELTETRKLVEKWEKDCIDCQEEIKAMEVYQEKLRKKIRQIDGLELYDSGQPKIDLGDLRLDQTTEELDKRFSQLAERDPNKLMEGHSD